MRFEMDVQGLGQIEERLGAISRDALLSAVEGGLSEGMERVASEAKALCPVDTGALRRSIVTRIYAGRDTVTGEVAVQRPYAAHVEMGGVGRPARPFLYPALKANQAKLTQRIAWAIGQSGKGERK